MNNINIVGFITIPVSRYEELIKAEEKIKAVERHMAIDKYHNAEDTASILDIEREKKDE